MSTSGVSVRGTFLKGALEKFSTGDLPAAASQPLAFVTIFALLAGSWLVVYHTGGTSNAFPHVFYVPVLLGAWFFGVTGGVLTAVAAGLLCGPVMPLDTAAGTAQAAVNWLSRAGFFVMVGGLGGTMCQALRRQAHALAERDRRSAISGLPNQIALEQDLDARIRMDRSNESGFVLAEVALSDLDQVIATFGHRKADQLVRAIGTELQTAAPFARPIYNDLADTFALVADDAEVADVGQLSETLIDIVEKPVGIAGLPVMTKGHVGIARYPCPYRKSNPDVGMKEAAQFRHLRVT